MSTYVKGEKIKYPTITEDILEFIEDENSLYIYKLSKSKFNLSKCIGCTYIYFIDMLIPIVYVDESSLAGSYSYSFFDGTVWMSINTQVTIESIDDDYYGIIVDASMLQSPFGVGTEDNNNITDKLALIESVKAQPAQEISEQAKTNFKTNMGSFADWNAQESEAGYIKNKLFRFISPNGEYEFKNALKQTDFTPIPNEYGEVYLYKKQVDADALQYVVANKKTGPYGSVYDCAYYPCDVNIHNKYVFYYGDYVFWFWIDADVDNNYWLCVEASQTDIFFPDDTIYIIHNFEDTVELEQIPHDCIPNTVLKTTRQYLDDNAKSVILDNLGIDKRQLDDLLQLTNIVNYKYLLNPWVIDDTLFHANTHINDELIPQELNDLIKADFRYVINRFVYMNDGESSQTVCTGAKYLDDESIMLYFENSDETYLNPNTGEIRNEY